MIWLYLLALPSFILYLIVLFIASIGIYQLIFVFHPKNRSMLDLKIDESKLEPVTILRPLKGIDSEMEKTLRSSFEQIYNHSKLEIIFCVQDPNDPCIPIVNSLIQEYPQIDSKLMIDSKPESYGPNPKINNLAKGYKNAKYDILWIMDSNVWSRNDTLMRSVYCLMKNISNDSQFVSLLDKKVKILTHVPLAWCQSKENENLKNFGAYLDEMFLATSHAKFYTGINRLQVAPCINGKSNIFKRSDLDEAVQKYQVSSSFTPGEGIKYFSKYIGEDNMIGIALFENVDGCAAMSMDMVLQPLNGQNSVYDYMDRRIRWLRVRKYMVLMATLIEPFTESLLSGLIGSWSINVLFKGKSNILWGWFFLHMTIWFLSDLNQYFSLFKYINFNSNIKINTSQRTVKHFIFFWVIREILALPIWIVAITGSQITWRGQSFKILKDLSTEML